MHQLLEEEHQGLIDLLDDLDECISTGLSVHQVHRFLNDFVALAEVHFKNEEAIMKTYRYTEIVEHKKEHADLLEQLYVLKNRLNSGHTPFGKDYMKLLRRWLEGHLSNADDRLEKFMFQADINN